MYIVKRLIALTFSALMLASSIGLSLNTHYCGGYEVGSIFSLGITDIACGMEAESKDKECENEHKQQIKMDVCCENVHQVILIEDDYQRQASSELADFNFIAAFIYTFVVPGNTEREFNQFTQYTPPLPKRDLQVIFQTFLI